MSEALGRDRDKPHLVDEIHAILVAGHIGWKEDMVRVFLGQVAVCCMLQHNDPTLFSECGPWWDQSDKSLPNNRVLLLYFRTFLEPCSDWY